MSHLIDDMLEEASSRPDAAEVYRRARKALQMAEQSPGDIAEDADDDIFPEPFRDAPDPNSIRHAPTEQSSGDIAKDADDDIFPEPFRDALSLNFIFPASLETIGRSPASHTHTKQEIEERHRSGFFGDVSFHSKNRETHTLSLSDAARYSGHSRSPLRDGHLSQNSPRGQEQSRKNFTAIPSHGENYYLDRSPLPSTPGHPDHDHETQLTTKREASSHKPHPKGNKKPKLDFPELDTQDVLKWIEKAKSAKVLKGSRNIRAPLNGEDILNRLYGRDQVVQPLMRAVIVQSANVREDILNRQLNNHGSVLGRCETHAQRSCVSRQEI
jgi:hypothetical protein